MKETMGMNNYFRSLKLPRLSDLFTQTDMEQAVGNTIAFTQLNQPAITKSFANMLYSYFNNMIPYKFDNTEFVTYFSNQITATIDVYTPSVLKWYTATQQQLTYIEQLQMKQSFMRTEKETQNEATQNNNLSQESFNPLTTGSDITLNSLQPSVLGGNQPNQTVVSATNQATFNTSSTARNNTLENTRNYTELDMNQYSNINLKPQIYLRGLFKKIATLFWILSDDYVQEGDAFDIWK